jgi:hypothetical protein
MSEDKREIVWKRCGYGDYLLKKSIDTREFQSKSHLSLFVCAFQSRDLDDMYPTTNQTCVLLKSEEKRVLLFPFLLNNDQELLKRERRKENNRLDQFQIKDFRKRLSSQRKEYAQQTVEHQH